MRKLYLNFTLVLLFLYTSSLFAQDILVWGEDRDTNSQSGMDGVYHGGQQDMMQKQMEMQQQMTAQQMRSQKSQQNRQQNIRRLQMEMYRLQMINQQIALPAGVTEVYKKCQLESCRVESSHVRINCYDKSSRVVNVNKAMVKCSSGEDCKEKLLKNSLASCNSKKLPTLEFKSLLVDTGFKGIPPSKSQNKRDVPSGKR